MPKVTQKNFPVLTSEQLVLVIKACKKPRDKALVYLMVDTGLRQSEIINLKWGDINLSSGLVRVLHGKGGKDRSVVIGVKTRRALLKYRRTITQTIEDPVFPLKASGLRMALERIGNRSGLRLNCHMMRRTFVTLSLTAGIGPFILQNMMVDGIKYQTVAGAEYDMLLFEAKEIESYIDNMYVVTQPEKTIADHIIWDSGVEEQFARDCENDDQVEFFIKLPEWFMIPTPIGTYNPDWALIFKNDKRLYFVAETKSVSEGATDNLRRNELLKIKSGKAHFAEFEDVEYRQVKRLRELI